MTLPFLANGISTCMDIRYDPHAGYCGGLQMPFQNEGVLECQQTPSPDNSHWNSDSFPHNSQQNKGKLEKVLRPSDWAGDAILVSRMSKEYPTSIQVIKLNE